MRSGVLFAAALLFGITSIPAHAVVPTQDEPIAVLRALDKITARVEELNIPEGQPYRFGTLTITVRACRVTPPEETPEAAAFLEISETKTDETSAPVFHGWMFASSPALSAMQHPVYDIWVIGCKVPPGAAQPVPAAATPLPPPVPPVTPATPVVPPQKPAAR
jgi:hypothetical protein